ncbi:hypothetical protein CNMCM5793_009151 [Aspergillus hiratsukae]|uniref:Uncharacterized protein n=1 Tax=Aspergillus hiratsukae TaxID=1194566 RepID=A0A8H6PU62_9EURO|nr:hypothetical protein CNMCM5793_009151 [Aspergillus hiratsukae]KAF7160116.1 hypothetical protein CNMCM6106_007576 [Aspergillus hiratsukae]
MLRIAMGGDSTDPAAYHPIDEDGKSLLFKRRFMAMEIAMSNEDSISAWRGLIREAIQAGADLRYPLPSPKLLQLHCAVANILHATGRGEKLGRILRDYGATGALARDGSTIISELLSVTLFPPDPFLNMPALPVELRYVWIIRVLFIAWFMCKADGRVFDQAADQVGTRWRPYVRDWPRPVFHWTPPTDLEWLKTLLKFLWNGTLKIKPDMAVMGAVASLQLPARQLRPQEPCNAEVAVWDNILRYFPSIPAEQEGRTFEQTSNEQYGYQALMAFLNAVAVTLQFPITSAWGPSIFLMPRTHIAAALLGQLGWDDPGVMGELNLQASMETRTDGRMYRPNGVEEAFAVMETKAYIRKRSGQKGCEIYMQQSAGMGTWILKDKRKGHTVPLNNQSLTKCHDAITIFTQTIGQAPVGKGKTEAYREGYEPRVLVLENACIPAAALVGKWDIIIVSYNFVSGLYRAIEQYKSNFRRFRE